MGSNPTLSATPRPPAAPDIFFAHAIESPADLAATQMSTDKSAPPPASGAPAHRLHGHAALALGAALALAVLAAHLGWPRPGPAADGAPTGAIFYMGGTLSGEFAIMAEALPLSPHGTTEQSMARVRNALRDSRHPLAHAALHFAEWMHRNQGISLARLHGDLGLALTGDWDFHNHGAMPVMRVPVADRQRVQASLAAIAKGLGTTLETMSIGGHRLTMLRLDERLRLGALLEDGALVLSLVADGESGDSIERRFAMAGPDAGRAARAEMAALARRHGYGQMGGFVNLQRLAAALRGGASGGADLYMTDGLRRLLSQQCAADIGQLAAAAPMLVFGIRDLRAADDSVQISQHLGLQIAHPQVLAMLQGAQGTVPAHPRSGHDKLLGIGLGHNLPGLARAIVQMRDMAAAASPTCPALAALRQAMMGITPALSGIYKAMLGDARGLGLSLYSLEPLSALLSINAPQPQDVYESLRDLLPAAGPLPADGGPLALQPLPYMDDLQVLARPGQLLMYSGAPAAQVAASAEPGGHALAAASFNQQRILDSMSAESWRQLWRATGNSQPLCPALAASAGFIHGQLLLYADDKGLQMEIVNRLRRINRSTLDMAGHWDTEQLRDDCTWQQMGTDSLQADGGGRHLARVRGQSCARSALRYNWRLDGGALVVHPVGEQRRPSCTAAWQDTGGAQGIHSCHIITMQDDRFQCRIYAPDGTWQLYRYSRRSAPP